MSLLIIDRTYIAHVFEDDGEGWYRVKARELIDRQVGRISTTHPRKLQQVGLELSYLDCCSAVTSYFSHLS